MRISLISAPVTLTKRNHVSLEIDIADDVPRPTVVDRHRGRSFDPLEDSAAVDRFKVNGWDVSLCVNMGQGWHVAAEAILETYRGGRNRTLYT